MLISTSRIENAAHEADSRHGALPAGNAGIQGAASSVASGISQEYSRIASAVDYFHAR